MVKIQGGGKNWGHLDRIVGLVDFVHWDGGVGGAGGEHLGCRIRRWIVVGLVEATVHAMKRITVIKLARTYLRKPYA